MYWYSMPLRTCPVSAVELIVYKMVVKRSLKCVILFFFKHPCVALLRQTCKSNIDVKTTQISELLAALLTDVKCYGQLASLQNILNVCEYQGQLILLLCSFVYTLGEVFFFSYLINRGKVKSTLYVSRHGFND